MYFTLSFFIRPVQPLSSVTSGPHIPPQTLSTQPFMNVAQSPLQSQMALLHQTLSQQPGLDPNYHHPNPQNNIPQQPFYNPRQPNFPAPQQFNYPHGMHYPPMNPMPFHPGSTPLNRHAQHPPTRSKRSFGQDNIDSSMHDNEQEETDRPNRKYDNHDY
jgi:hypothetical protein